jgi:hypothetical protein
LFLDTLSELVLQENEMTGTLPSEMGFLQSLRTLDLSGNFKVTGSNISELARITTLNLWNYQKWRLSDQFPHRWAPWTD